MPGRNIVEILFRSRDRLTPAAKGIPKQLDKVDKSAKKAGKALGGFGKGAAGADARAAGLAESVRGGLNPSLLSLSKLLPGLAGAAGLGALVKGFSASVRVAAEAETGIARISTLGNFTQRQLAGLSSGVDRIAVSTGVAGANLRDALFQAISAGVPAEKSLQLLRVAARSAVGGFADVTTTVDGLTSTLNSFGLGADQAGRVADVFFETNKRGKTTIQELAGSISIAAPLAASLGLEFEDLAAFTSTLTQTGASTNVVMTQLRSILSAVIRPGEEAQNVAKRLGIDFSKAGIAAKGFSGWLLDIIDKTGGSEKTLGKLFGRVEGLSAVIALGGKLRQKFIDDNVGMRKAAGQAASAFDKASATYEQATKRLDESLRVFTEAQGKALLPLATQLKNLAAEFIEAITRKPGERLKGSSIADEIDRFRKGIELTGDPTGRLAKQIRRLREEQARLFIEAAKGFPLPAFLKTPGGIEEAGEDVAAGLKKTLDLERLGLRLKKSRVEALTREIGKEKEFGEIASALNREALKNAGLLGKVEGKEFKARLARNKTLGKETERRIQAGVDELKENIKSGRERARAAGEVSLRIARLRGDERAAFEAGLARETAAFRAQNVDLGLIAQFERLKREGFQREQDAKRRGAEEARLKTAARILGDETALFKLELAEQVKALKAANLSKEAIDKFTRDAIAKRREEARRKEILASGSFAEGWRLAYKDFEENALSAAQFGAKAFKEFSAQTERTLSDLIFATFTGKLEDAKDIFRAFGESLVRIVADNLAKLINEQLIQEGISSIVGLIGSLPFFEEGGIVNKPTLGVIGEGGPELILPLTGKIGQTIAREALAAVLKQEAIKEAFFEQFGAFDPGAFVGPAELPQLSFATTALTGLVAFLFTDAFFNKLRTTQTLGRIGGQLIETILGTFLPAFNKRPRTPFEAGAALINERSIQLQENLFEAFLDKFNDAGKAQRIVNRIPFGDIFRAQLKVFAPFGILPPATALNPFLRSVGFRQTDPTKRPFFIEPVPMRRGGLALRPTEALLAEAGAEAVLPLDSPRSIEALAGALERAAERMRSPGAVREEPSVVIDLRGSFFPDERSVEALFRLLERKGFDVARRSFAA